MTFSSLLPVTREIVWSVVGQLGPAEGGQDGGEEGPGERSQLLQLLQAGHLVKVVKTGKIVQVLLIVQVVKIVQNLEIVQIVLKV